MPPKKIKIATRQPKTKKNKLPPVNLADLQQTKEAAIKKHRGSARTHESYAGYIKRGKEFLTELVSAKKKQTGDDELVTDVVDLCLLAKSFDNPPNIYSAMAL